MVEKAVEKRVEKAVEKPAASPIITASDPVVSANVAEPVAQSGGAKSSKSRKELVVRCYRLALSLDEVRGAGAGRAPPDCGTKSSLDQGTVAPSHADGQQYSVPGTWSSACAAISPLRHVWGSSCVASMEMWPADPAVTDCLLQVKDCIAAAQKDEEYQRKKARTLKSGGVSAGPVLCLGDRHTINIAIYPNDPRSVSLKSEGKHMQLYEHRYASICLQQTPSCSSSVSAPEVRCITDSLHGLPLAW